MQRAAALSAATVHAAIEPRLSLLEGEPAADALRAFDAAERSAPAGHRLRPTTAPSISCWRRAVPSPTSQLGDVSRAMAFQERRRNSSPILRSRGADWRSCIDARAARKMRCAQSWQQPRRNRSRRSSAACCDSQRVNTASAHSYFSVPRCPVFQLKMVNYLVESPSSLSFSVQKRCPVLRMNTSSRLGL